MSLTSQLDDAGSWIRRHFEERFPGLTEIAADLRAKLRATPEHLELESSAASNDYGFVGTAFEIRVGVAHRVVDWSSCLSNDGFRIAQGMSPKAVVRTTLRPSFEEATRLLTTSPPGRQAVAWLEERLCWAALFLARLEALTRIGFGAQALVDRGNSMVDGRMGWLDIPQAWIADVFALARVHFGLRRENRGAWSSARRSVVPGLATTVGGADVDIVAGDLMLDFKTTRSVRHVLTDVRQILGYLLLDGDDTLGVRRIELEYVRFGVVFQIDTASLIRRASRSQQTLAGARTVFAQAAARELGR